MRLAKAASVLDYRLQSNFEVVRRQLLQDKFARRLDKPLAYWALPKDRRLPLALLGRKLGDLVNTPFQELVATPGVGHKKLESLVRLMCRATEEVPAAPNAAELSPDLPAADASGADVEPLLAEPMPRPNGHFDETLVSELVWEEWQATVRRYGMGHEKLARFAPSLRDLPSVIWQVPLNAFLGRSIAELRGRKTYGEKRIRAILEVFYTLHNLLARSETRNGLAVSVLPAFVPPLVGWLAMQLDSDQPPSTADIERSLIRPLLEQWEKDAGPIVVQLASARLGLNGDCPPVRCLARRLHVTRARVYQMLDECREVMEIRWPEGQNWLNRLLRHLEAVGADQADVALIARLLDLAWPRGR
ncbi:MAG: hypothetical protein J5I93_19895 [Pirellulaceae bacterium]|nr:hypothetical protein [Pirellulaceae bacterium]